MTFQTRRLSDQRVLVREEYAHVLRRTGLDTLEALLEPHGEVFKKNSRRSVVRVETGPGEEALFVKAHPNPPGPSLLSRWLIHHWTTPAAHEWRLLVELESLGILAMRPVALAEEGGKGFPRRSVLVTAEVAGAERVEDHVLHMDVKAKRRLIVELADLTRRFHGAGFYHKDLYLGHILVRPDGEGCHHPTLIDLQRAERHGSPRSRWFVKDIAQMLYTAPSPAVTACDKMRFFKLYRQVERLGRVDRTFLARVMARYRRMVRRFERKGPIRDWK